jgi:hypothetical protein
MRISVNGSIIHTTSIDKNTFSTKQPAYDTEHILRCSNMLPTVTECIVEGMIESDNDSINQIWQPIGKFVFKRYFNIEYGDVAPMTLKTYYADGKSIFIYDNSHDTEKFKMKLPNNVPATVKINGMIGGLNQKITSGYIEFEAYQTKLRTIIVELNWNT